MAETIIIRKEAIADLTRLREDFDAIVESLELMSNKQFMAANRRSKEQIRKRRFVDWHEL